MIRRGAALPSVFWLLLCIVSFLAALLAWNQQRSERLRRSTPVPVLTAPAPVAQPRPVVSVAPEEPAPARSAAPPFVPQTRPHDPNSGPKVLRCVVKGRVTYLDAAAVCPDGSAGRITILSK
jgi:hypothetical protein